MNKAGQGIPWGLLKRIGEGSITDNEVEALLQLFQNEAEEPPRWFITRALRAPEQVAAQQRPGLVSRLMASLVFDSGLRPQLVGVRGGAAPVQRMSYSAQGVSLHLESREEPDGLVTVSGQAIAEDGAEPFEAALICEGRTAAQRARVDEFGFFSLGHVIPTTYALVLRGESVVIEIPAIVVG